jgi:hypothetical protein
MRGVRSATGRIFELVPTLVHRDDGPPVPVASASEQARLGDARRGCGLAARCLHGTAPPGMARQAVAVAAPVPERAEPALYSLVPATIDRPVAAPQTASRPRFDQHPAAERTGVQEEPSSTLVRRCWYGSTRPTCRDDIERLHKKKRRLPREFVDPKEREDFLRADQLDALMPLLGRHVVESMLGGARGLQQLSDPARREAQLRAKLIARAGSEGSQLAGLRSLLKIVRVYAHEVMHAPLGREDEALWPMTEALANDIVASEHRRATSEGAGARGGITQGWGTRDLFVLAASLKWPLDLPKGALDSAAPPPTGHARMHAGTLPIAGKCQLEFFASGGLRTEAYRELLSEQAADCCEFYSRSLLAGAIDQSARIGGEGARTKLWPDEVDPHGVMRGNAYMAKDGAPIDLYAPAEGFLGRYEWFSSHLERVLRLGQLFPVWERTGRKASIRHARGLTSKLQEPDKIRDVLSFLMSLPPLAFTEEEMKAMRLTSHTGHSSPPEWGRQAGERPRYEPPLPDVLAGGFSDRDCDALGHWLRDAGAKQAASASQAAMAARGGAEREAAARALAGGRPASRGAMRNYYGSGGASGNRFSEREIQLSVRQRLAHTVQHLLRGTDWRRLPRGQADLGILSSVRS